MAVANESKRSFWEEVDELVAEIESERDLRRWQTDTNWGRIAMLLPKELWCLVYSYCTAAEQCQLWEGVTLLTHVMTCEPEKELLAEMPTEEEIQARKINNGDHCELGMAIGNVRYMP